MKTIAFALLLIPAVAVAGKAKAVKAVARAGWAHPKALASDHGWYVIRAEHDDAQPHYLVVDRHGAIADLGVFDLAERQTIGGVAVTSFLGVQGLLDVAVATRTPGYDNDWNHWIVRAKTHEVVCDFAGTGPGVEVSVEKRGDDPLSFQWTRTSATQTSKVVFTLGDTGDCRGEVAP